MGGPRIAGLELGGTKCVALVAHGREIVLREVIPTTTPAETLGALDAMLLRWHGEAPFDALGIASFGPIGLDPARGDHGCITTTPKPRWSGTDILGRYRRLLGMPTGFDTDVTGAALAEHLWGGARGTSCNVYLTIGTGLGGGAVVNGRPLRGLLHPEMGHARVRRDPADSFDGICPAHGDCLEGLIAGPALAARTGMPATEIAHDHIVWRRVAAELGELLAMLVLTLSPQQIALGGGVASNKPWLFDAVRQVVADRLAGYVAVLDQPEITRLIVPTVLGADAGPLGAIALGMQALDA